MHAVLVAFVNDDLRLLLSRDFTAALPGFTRRAAAAGSLHSRAGNRGSIRKERGLRNCVRIHIERAARFDCTGGVDHRFVVVDANCNGQRACGLHARRPCARSLLLRCRRCCGCILELRLKHNVCRRHMQHILPGAVFHHRIGNDFVSKRIDRLQGALFQLFSRRRIHDDHDVIPRIRSVCFRDYSAYGCAVFIRVAVAFNLVSAAGVFRRGDFPVSVRRVVERIGSARAFVILLAIEGREILIRFLSGGKLRELRKQRYIRIRHYKAVFSIYAAHILNHVSGRTRRQITHRQGFKLVAFLRRNLDRCAFARLHPVHCGNSSILGSICGDLASFCSRDLFFRFLQFFLGGRFRDGAFYLIDDPHENRDRLIDRLACGSLRAGCHRIRRKALCGCTFIRR